MTRRPFYQEQYLEYPIPKPECPTCNPPDTEAQKQAQEFAEQLADEVAVRMLQVPSHEPDA